MAVKAIEVGASQDRIRAIKKMPEEKQDAAELKREEANVKLLSDNYLVEDFSMMWFVCFSFQCANYKGGCCACVCFACSKQEADPLVPAARHRRDPI
jgi:hypothetical protein